MSNFGKLGAGSTTVDSVVKVGNVADPLASVLAQGESAIGKTTVIGGKKGILFAFGLGLSMFLSTEEAQGQNLRADLQVTDTNYILTISGDNNETIPGGTVNGI